MTEEEIVLQATREKLEAPDEVLNAQIAEKIDRASDRGCAFLDQMEKRLREPSAQVQFLTLELVESCSNLCSEHFRANLTNQAFLSSIGRLTLIPDAEPRVANKAKALILRWSKSLGRKHPIFSSLEKQLRARGVDFGDGPVKTKVDQSNKTKISPRPQIIEPSSPDSSAEKFEPEYVDKIRGNLRTVVDYIFMARDMLASVENYSIDDTLVSIISCIEEMHRRLTILVIEIEDSEFVAVFIRLIDLIQETLGWYQALKKRQKDAVKLMQVNKEKLELAIQNLGTGVPVILDNESHLEENHAKSSEEKGTEDFLGLNFMSNTSENSSKGKKDAVEDLFQFQLKLASENSANAEKSKSESKESNPFDQFFEEISGDSKPKKDPKLNNIF